MLTRVEVVTPQGAVLDLPLGDISSSLQIESIEGLDPVKATIASSSFAQLDGAQYQSSRRETRDIKLRISFRPDYALTTVKALRAELYRFFMPKSQVNLGFFSDDDSGVRIHGYVESFETSLFTKEPAVDISVHCLDPDFYDPTPVVVDGMSTASEDELTFVYDGNVETGFLLNFSAGRVVTEFNLYNRPENGELQSLEFASYLDLTDEFELSTIPGDKYATRTQGTSRRSVLYGVSPQSVWLKLFPGINNIRLYEDGEPFSYTITYTNRYGGL